MGFSLEIEFDTEEESDDCECPKCGAECEEDDKFCCECGAKLPAPKAAVASARKGALSKMAMPEAD
jgi:hypothetical protein